ncbi:MAG: GntR family transcriptional regulator [Alphaproteobacteria bacterium]|nr:GntR family transcriptional regulator [Alphaproteobacteria bacterium]
MTALKLAVQPIEAEPSFRDRAYASLKQAITTMDIYASREPIRLDERQLSQDLGISRTPIREALNRLEQEGFIRSIPRKGMFIVRKTKKEILEMIAVWAALESMAARLITQNASDEEIATLRRLFVEFQGPKHKPSAHIDEYSEANVRFHQAIVSLANNKLLTDTMENLFIHMRSIRRKTIGENDRAERSIIDHLNIIEALEKRQTERAEQLVRQHSLDLATHVEKHVDYLD